MPFYSPRHFQRHVPKLKLIWICSKDLIHISEAKTGRKLVDWYLRNLARTY